MDAFMKISYPAELPDALHLLKTEFEQEAKMAMAMKLFEMKRISSGMAALIAGIDRVSFLLTLHKYGISMQNLEPQDLIQDIQNA